MIFGSRVDIANTSMDKGIVYRNGYDFFFFDKSIIPRFPKSDYALGAPWWDYWAAFCPKIEGVKTKELLSPIAYHVIHPMNYNMKLWFHYGKEYTSYIMNKPDLDTGDFREIYESHKVTDMHFVISSAAILVNKFIQKSTEKIYYTTSPKEQVPVVSEGYSYKVSAIVSVYKSERFIKGCLDNLLQQSLYKNNLLEIVIVNSNSPENDEEIIKDYCQKYEHIVYIKTDERETVYAAWNRGIIAATGEYITNANTDDRHRSDALEIMARALDSIPEIGIVYADCFVTEVENQTFDNCTPKIRYDLPDFNLGTQLSSSCFGAQPMWRKSVHKELGYFDTQWGIAGDYDFFIKVAWKYKAHHIRESLGLFLSRKDSVSGNDNAQETILETLKILRKYRTEIPLEELYPLLSDFKDNKIALVSALWDLGNLCALSPYRDYELALQYYQKAIDVEGLTEAEREKITKGLANNAGVISFCLRNYEQGLNLLQAANSEESKLNLELIQKAKDKNITLYALNFKMTQFNHPVVFGTRMAKGLLLNESGNFEFSDDHQQVFWDGYIGMDGVPVADDEVIRAQNLLPRVSTPLSMLKEVHKSKKRILMTMYGWNEEGGGTLLPKQIARELHSLGHEVHVFYAAATPDNTLPSYSLKQSNDEGIHLYGVFNRATVFYDLLNPEREINDSNVVDLFRQVFDYIKPDVVHFHNFLGLSAGIISVAQQNKVPYVFSPHNYWLLCPRLYLINKNGELCSGPNATGTKCAECVDNKQNSIGYSERLTKLTELFSHRNALIIPPSSRVAELFISHGVPKNKLQIVQQVSPMSEKLWRNRRTKTTAIHSQKNSDLVVTYCGSIIPLKGVHILIAAAQTCKGNIRIALYGKGSENYINYLKSIDKKNILELKGSYDMGDLPDILNRTDTLVAPSLCEETGGLVVTEALAAAVPVIVSRIGGYTDLIDDGKNGFLFTPGSINELSSILSKFGEYDNLLDELRTNIKKPRFFRDYIHDIESIYDTLIESSN